MTIAGVPRGRRLAPRAAGTLAGGGTRTRRPAKWKHRSPRVRADPLREVAQRAADLAVRCRDLAESRGLTRARPGLNRARVIRVQDGAAGLGDGAHEPAILGVDDRQRHAVD